MVFLSPFFVTLNFADAVFVGVAPTKEACKGQWHIVFTYPLTGIVGLAFTS